MEDNMNFKYILVHILNSSNTKTFNKKDMIIRQFLSLFFIFVFFTFIFIMLASL